ncbi:SurA N-terminal domain-containing protein [Marinobacter litoralis]|uniref:SurA N-terminal domain-containing protein n=1 Tax=Marinobacter litoralis TaxID=187981 RepID=UPI0018EAE9F0|nr:SurA N-terminal domain-containing protein [Marinobacter litoralis]MBJ6137551.1 SurA N-terminal domain-containing protein [Marinobacter litoralis]
MLQDIRDNAQSTIAKVIVGLLIVSLSIWGMDAIIGGFSGEPEVATVNGTDITEREFLRTVQLETQQRLMQMETPDPSLVDEDQLRTDVLEALIQEAVLTQDAQSQGLELSDADIDALITQMPQFQVDGKYSPERFAATVRNLGMGVAEFRASMHKSYVTNQIRAAIAQTALATPESAAQLLAIQNQTRDFRVLSLSKDQVADQVAVTDDEIATYYEENKAQFQEPEKVDAVYLTLSQATLADAVEVSEDEVRAEYESRAEQFAREERKAAHILIEAGAEAEETLSTIQSRLEAGESFADLAKEFSVDTVSGRDGGDLGYAGRGVYDEAFEEALFALDEGEISGPVETSFGIHLIRLDDVRRSDVPSFEELEGQLRNELARAKAEERYVEVRAELADAAYAADDLAGPASELGLELREVQGVTRDGGAEPFGHAGLVRQLFSADVLEDGYNTELIDVGDNVSIVARVKAHHEARQLELTDVRDDIKATLEVMATREALQAKANKLVADIEAGDSVEQGNWKQFEAQGRGAAGDLSPLVLRKAFTMPRPNGEQSTVDAVVGLAEAHIIVLEAVNEGDVDRENAEFQHVQQFLTQLQGQREYAVYQQYLRETAEIERN